MPDNFGLYLILIEKSAACLTSHFSQLESQIIKSAYHL